LTDKPQTWHYGLVAQWWAEFNVAKPEELAFYQRCILRFGQPALDVACGAGRLLVPLSQAGLEVDGCDLSPDMLAHCRAKAAEARLAPQLYVQAMHALDLPRQYRTIYICDSFGIGGRREQDAEALRRCYLALAPGGALILNNYLPYGDANDWQYWLPEWRHRMPIDWPEPGVPRPTSDGAAIDLRTRLFDFEPLEQRLTVQMRATLWRDGLAVAEEEYTLQNNMYFHQEFLLLLGQTGFSDVSVYGDYSESALTAEHGMVVYVARK
jgi:SAM-dependent methyltransferase